MLHSLRGMFPGFPPFFTGEEFRRFSFLPIEIRLKIWRFALPPPRVIVACPGTYPEIQIPPRFPGSVLILMQVNREARKEILEHFLLVRFSFEIRPQIRARFGSLQLSPSSSCEDCWPTRKSEPNLSDFGRKWASRGSWVVNARTDVVFVTDTAMVNSDGIYGVDSVPAMFSALKAVRYLALEMQSWKDFKSILLKILPHMNNLREVVFVRVGNARESSKLPMCEQTSFVSLERYTDPQDAMFGDLVRKTILMDFERARERWPAWNIPKIEFIGVMNVDWSTYIDPRYDRYAFPRGNGHEHWWQDVVDALFRR